MDFGWSFYTLILYTYLADLLLGHSSLSTSAQDSLYSGYWCKGKRSITTHLSPAKKKSSRSHRFKGLPMPVQGAKLGPFAVRPCQNGYSQCKVEILLRILFTIKYVVF